MLTIPSPSLSFRCLNTTVMRTSSIIFQDLDFLPFPGFAFCLKGGCNIYLFFFFSTESRKLSAMVESDFTITLGSCLSTAGCISSSSMDMFSLQSSPKLSHPLLLIEIISLELFSRDMGGLKADASSQGKEEISVFFM